MSSKLDSNSLPFSSLSLSLRGTSSQGENARIEDLPRELFDRIIYFSTLATLEALACVSKGMRAKVLEGVNYNEPRYIRLFINTVAQKLEASRFHQQRDSLTITAQNIAFHNFNNLRLLKEYVLGLRGEFLRGIRGVGV